MEVSRIPPKKTPCQRPCETPRRQRSACQIADKTANRIYFCGTRISRVPDTMVMFISCGNQWLWRTGDFALTEKKLRNNSSDGAIYNTIRDTLYVICPLLGLIMFNYSTHPSCRISTYLLIYVLIINKLIRVLVQMIRLIVASAGRPFNGLTSAGSS